MLYATILTCLALGWLISRAWSVLRTPVQDLVKTLGIELPTSPIVSLHSIKSDQITLHWTRPESLSAVTKYHIQVNGVEVGQSARSENAVTVTGLKPDHLYNVRVIAASAGNFQAPSRLIRLRTTSKARDASTPKDEDVGFLDSSDESPGIFAHEANADGSTTGLSTAMRRARSHSLKRKNKPPEKSRSLSRPRDGKNVQQAAADLEALRLETEDTEAQIVQAEAEFEEAKAAMMQDRDNVKNAHKEREDFSADLRKEVASLDRQSRTAQSRKAAKEKLLRQKETDRKKMEADIQRWEDEIAEIDLKVEQIAKDKKEVSKAAEVRIKAIRTDMNERNKELRKIDEDVKKTGVDIKKLEEERRKLAGDDDDEERERQRIEAEKDRLWEIKHQNLHQKYAAECRSWEQAHANFQQASEQLAWWQARQGGEQPLTVSLPAQTDNDASSQSFKKAKTRRSRQRKSRASSAHSSSFNALPLYDSRFPGTATFESFSTTSPPSYHATPVAPFVSMDGQLLREDKDGPTSPHVNSLLPSNLLDNEEANALDSFLPFDRPLADPFNEALFPMPTSPASSGSRSASLFSSPRESQQHIAMFALPEDSRDPDRASLRSSGSGLGVGTQEPSHAKRFSGLFSFRQRKAMSADLPLGLTNETQSLPENHNDSKATLGPIGSRQRSDSASNSFASRFKHGDIVDGNGPVPRRVTPFNIFGTKFEPMDRSSSRRTSISSLENILPRPGSSSHFGWPETRQESKWLSTFPGQQNPLTLPSSPLGNSSIATQAPIGTRPNSSALATARLNPAAPTFTLAQDEVQGSHSIRTQGSVDATSRASLDTWSMPSSTDLSNVQAALPASSSKESFISKITRKSSSSKFALSSSSYWKGGKEKDKPTGSTTSLFSKKGDVLSGGELDDEDAQLPMTPASLVFEDAVTPNLEKEKEKGAPASGKSKWRMGRGKKKEIDHEEEEK